MGRLVDRVLAIVIGVEQAASDNVMVRLSELAALAEACRTAFLAIGSTSNWEPASGSAGARVREALATADPAVTSDGIAAGFELVQEVVVTYLEIAANDLAGLSALYRCNEAIFPPIPLIRSIIEHSAHAMWVIGADPQLSPTAILARAYLEEFASCESGKQAAVQMGDKTTTAYQGARTRWKSVRDRALKAFPDNNPTDLGVEGGRMLGGQRLLGPEAGVGWMFDLLERFRAVSVTRRQAEGIYAFLCAGTHPSLYQARQLRRRRELRKELTSLERELKLAISAYYNALGYTMDFLGCDRAPHEALTAAVEMCFPVGYWME